MNNIKMNTRTLVSTWLHHWFPRISRLKKNTTRFTPTNTSHFLLTYVLFRHLDHRAGTDLPWS